MTECLRKLQRNAVSQLLSHLKPLWRHACWPMQAQGVLKLLLVCILGVQAGSADSWEARDPVGPNSPTSLPAARSRAFDCLLLLLERGWHQERAQSEIKPGTAGHDRGAAIEAEGRLASCGEGESENDASCVLAARKEAGWGPWLALQRSSPHEVSDQGQVRRRQDSERRMLAQLPSSCNCLDACQLLHCLVGCSARTYGLAGERI